MSRIGPPPGLKKNSGSGCQCSIPCDIRKHVPESTLPIFPASISSRARRPPAPRNVSGASTFRLCAERFLAENVFSGTERCVTYCEVRGWHRQVHDDVNI